MEQSERNRITSSHTQAHRSLTVYQPNAEVKVRRETLMDLIELVVELEHAQRVT
jgi:hypothetical protein